MKKFITLLAVALSLPFLFACNKDNNQAGSGSASIKTGTRFSSAKTFSTGGMSISFNADGSFIATKPTALKGVINRFEVITGTYTFANAVYTLSTDGKVWGTLTVVNDDTVRLTINALEIDEELSVSVSTPSEANENQRASNHTWKPVETIINYRALNFSHSGADFNALENWAREHFGEDIQEDPIFPDNMKMTECIFTDSQIGFVFANGQEVVTNNISVKDGLNFTLKQLDNVDNVEILNGNASVTFDQGKCILSINATFQEQKAEVIITFGL